MTSTELDAPLPERLPRRKLLWLEFAAVMLFLYVPAMISTFSDGSSYLHDAFYTIDDLAYNFGRIALVLFVVWVGDGTLAELGFRKPKWGEDLLNALIVIGIVIAGVAFEAALSPHRTSNRSSSLMRGAGLAAPAFIRTIFGGVREVVVGSYIITRLLELVEQPALAIVIAATLISAEFWRFGVTGVAPYFALYAALGYVMYKSRRITPFVIVLTIGIGFRIFMSR